MSWTEALSKLENIITVIKDQTLKIQEMYFSNTPQTITVKRLNAEGEPEDVDLPNIAKIHEELLAAGHVIPISGYTASVVAPYSLHLESDDPNLLNLDLDSEYLIQVDIMGEQVDANHMVAIFRARMVILARLDGGGFTGVNSQQEVNDEMDTSATLSVELITSSGNLRVVPKLVLPSNGSGATGIYTFWGTMKIKKVMQGSGFV